MLPLKAGLWHMHDTILTAALGSTLHKNDLYYEKFLIYNSWIIEDIHGRGWRDGLTALTEEQDSVPSTQLGGLPPLHIQGNPMHFSAPHGHIPTHRQHICAQFKKILKSFHGAT